MSRPGGVAGDQLRSFVERIENVEEEIKSLTEDKKEIFAEAKGQGFDVKILKEVIRLRKQDPDERDEHDSLLEVYLHALEEAEEPEEVEEAPVLKKAAETPSQKKPADVPSLKKASQIPPAKKPAKAPPLKTAA